MSFKLITRKKKITKHESGVVFEFTMFVNKFNTNEARFQKSVYKQCKFKVQKFIYCKNKLVMHIDLEIEGMIPKISDTSWNKSIFFEKNVYLSGIASS